ncbi:MAG: 16S rRNA (adenine(1518)-N(6)/adenine(1519)-N(6))-dimethyltransferase RsmA [Calditrichia bacterium]
MSEKKPNRKFAPPRKSLSQNFLIDVNISEKIAASLDSPDSAWVLEIGPGRGALTGFLIRRFAQVIAVELDDALAEDLPHLLQEPENLQVVHNDFLTMNLDQGLPCARSAGAVAGSLPYHITSPILFKIIDHRSCFREAVLMVQKEVGERLTANPGSRSYGIPSVILQLHADVEYLFTVPAHLFYPRPKVDSAVVHIRFTEERERQAADLQLFGSIVKGVFNQRRKMLRNTLSAFADPAILERLTLDLTRRPETLSVSEFIKLVNEIIRLKG